MFLTASEMGSKTRRATSSRYSQTNRKAIDPTSARPDQSPSRRWNSTLSLFDKAPGFESVVSNWRCHRSRKTARSSSWMSSMSLGVADRNCRKSLRIWRALAPLSYPPSPSWANSAPPTIRLLAFQMKSRLDPQRSGYSSDAYHPSQRQDPSDQETGNRPSNPIRRGIGPIMVHPIFPEVSATRKFTLGMPE